MSLTPPFRGVDPAKLAIRCKHCGNVFTFGDMLEAHADRQADMPPGRVYVKCPKCDVVEPGGLQDPTIPTIGG